MPKMTLDEIAACVGGRVVGDGSTVITGVAGLADAGPRDIAFLANRRYEPLLATTRAGGILLRRGEEGRCPRPAVVVDNPDWACAVIGERFGPPPFRPPAGVHPLAFCAAGARLGAGAAVGPFAVVEDGASIGDGTILFPHAYVGAWAVVGRDCLIYPGAVLRERVRVGDRVTLHSGAVIGSDGFGYAAVDGVHKKIPQIGTVVIDDDVEVGANATIDRARFGETRVRRGTKIDNLVMVAHNVEIGEHCLLAGQVGISGSTKVGNRVLLGGQVGLSGHLDLGDGVRIAAKSGVSKSFPAGTVLSGIPARPNAEYLRVEAAVQRVPALIEEVRALRAEVERLRSEAPSAERGAAPTRRAPRKARR